MYIQYIAEVSNSQMQFVSDKISDVVLALFRDFRASERAMNRYIAKINIMRSNLDKVLMLESRLTNATAPLPEVSVCASHDPGRLGDDILELVRLKTCAQDVSDDEAQLLVQAREAVVQNAQLLGECITLLQHIPNAEAREALFMHYMDGLPWERVAQKMHYSERKVYELRTEGLAQAAEIYRTLSDSCSKMQ